MTIERAIETIEKFPVDPDAQIIYVVYNTDMVQAAESLISEIHGKNYLKEYVYVIAQGSALPEELEDKTCTIYFDPALHDYKGNGYN